MKEKLLTTEEVAPSLGVKPTILLAWRNQGRGPRYHKVGRRCLYTSSDVESWLDEQVVIPAPKPQFTEEEIA